MTILRITAAVILSSLMGGLTACQDSSKTTFPQEASSVGAVPGEESLLLSNSLRVVDENQQPVANARILIGLAPGQPFANNELVTDEDGYFTIPAQWTTPQPISIEAPGYVHSSFDNVEPYVQDFQLSVADGTQNIEVKGDTTGFKNIRRDGQIDFGLVIPGFSRRALIRFDISDVISPSNDDLSVLGFTFGIPSNLTLPRQQESYIFPIEFNKPMYRVYTKAPGTYSYLAAQGTFPLKKVFDEIRGGRNIFELVDELTFQRAGIQDINVVGGGVSHTLDVAAIEFNSNISLKAPAYSSDLKMFGMSAIQVNGMLFPADLKTLAPRQTRRLKVPAQGELYKASLLIQDYSNSSRSPNFQQMSISLQEGQDARPAQFLPMVARPELAGDEILLDAPQPTAGIRPMATYLILSEVETITGGAINSERRTRLWEIVSNSWVDRVELPEFQFTKKANRTYRWEVLYLGQDETQTPWTSLEDVTHITRNAVSF